MLESFWDNVEQCLDAVEKASTVDEVITILNQHFEPSSGEAFFAGSGGDRQMMGTLGTAGWQIVWAEASYHFVARDKNGDLLTYSEGDVDRGDHRPPGCAG